MMISKKFLLFLLYFAGFCDIVTFLISGPFRFYETNPIYSYFPSIAVMLGVKVIVLGVFSWFYLRVKPGTLEYMATIGLLLIFLLQLLGAYSNIHVTQTAPEITEPAYTPQETTKIYGLFMVITYVYPVVMGTLAFWVVAHIKRE